MSALHHIPNRTKKLPPLRVGIGGPVGSGKTTLLEMLCKGTTWSPSPTTSTPRKTSAC
jgi:ATPase subunit of ABC transporter with duplicated ATPase domains